MKRLQLKRRMEDSEQESTPDFNFDNHFLNLVLLNCIMNSKFLRKIKSLVNTDIYKTKEKQFIAQIIYDYYDEFKKAPKTHFYNIFYQNEHTISPKIFDKATDVVSRLRHLEDEDSNPEFLLSSIQKAIRHFKLEEASINFAQMVKAKKYEEGLSSILKAIKIPDEIKKTYYDFSQDSEYKIKRKEGKIYDVKMVKPLNRLIPGMNFSWLVTWVGATKSGKTFWLLEHAIDAVLQGFNVLFVSREMNKQQIDERIDQMTGFLGSKPNEPVETMKYIKKSDKWVKKVSEIPTIYDEKEVERARRVLFRNGGSLWVYDAVGMNFSYIDLDLIIDEIQQETGKPFHVAVIDYLGEMTSPHPKIVKKKEVIAANTSGMKNIGKEKNLLVITAMQGNREAMKATTPKSDLIADAIEPVWISDLIPIICQSVKEEKNNVYRVFIAEFRHGKKHGMLSLVRDLERGQICLDVASENLIPQSDADDEDNPKRKKKDLDY